MDSDPKRRGEQQASTVPELLLNCMSGQQATHSAHCLADSFWGKKSKAERKVKICGCNYFREATYLLRSAQACDFPLLQHTQFGLKKKKREQKSKAEGWELPSIASVAEVFPGYAQSSWAEGLNIIGHKSNLLLSPVHTGHIQKNESTWLNLKVRQHIFGMTS